MPALFRCRQRRSRYGLYLGVLVEQGQSPDDKTGFDQGAGRDDSIGADAYMVADQCTELVRIRREPLYLSPAVYAFVLPLIAGVGDNAASPIGRASGRERVCQD